MHSMMWLHVVLDPVGWHQPKHASRRQLLLRSPCCAQVAAACLYIVCRQDSKPFMLIDFSDALQINVFMLGNVFLQLCKLLRLQEQPMFTRYDADCAATAMWNRAFVKLLPVFMLLLLLQRSCRS